MKQIDELHSQLYSGPAQQLGDAFWYILKGHNILVDKCHSEPTEKFRPPPQTPFGKEVGQDEIHWWIFRKEKEINELEKHSVAALASIQKLKERTLKLSETYETSDYGQLIETINNFCINNAQEISKFHDYILWLYTRDILATSMFFSYRVWGSTRRTDRFIEIIADKIVSEDSEKMSEIIDTVLGLTIRHEYTYYLIHREMQDEIVQNTDPEHGHPSISTKAVISRTTNKALKEFAIFFEYIRNTIQNILLDIEKYKCEKDLLNSESFWINVLMKAREPHRIETKLLEFKKTYSIWHTTKTEKMGGEIILCEDIACFANHKGGVIFVGIDDKTRDITGIDNLELKIREIRHIIEKRIENDFLDGMHLMQLLVKEEKNLSCLAIIIPQTKNPVGVKDEDNHYSYPIRSETGLNRLSPSQIQSKKATVKNDNYDFIEQFKQWIYE